MAHYLDEQRYKGYSICKSRISGKWWIESLDEHFICWAKDEADAKAIIDTELAQ